MSKQFFANTYFKCGKCERDVNQGDEFKFFHEDKICMECWEVLLNYYNDEM